MTTMNKFGSVLGMAAVLMLGGCETTKTSTNPIGFYPGIYPGYGVVQSVEIEKQTQQQPTPSNVTVRMDNGSQQTVSQSTNTNIRVGDRVQIENGAVLRY